MTHEDFYKFCESEAKKYNTQLAMCYYLDSIARSMAHIADYYDKFFGDPKDNEEYIE